MLENLGKCFNIIVISQEIATHYALNYCEANVVHYFGIALHSYLLAHCAKLVAFQSQLAPLNGDQGSNPLYRQPYKCYNGNSITLERFLVGWFKIYA